MVYTLRDSASACGCLHISGGGEGHKLERGKQILESKKQNGYLVPSRAKRRPAKSELLLQLGLFTRNYGYSKCDF